MSPIGRVFVVLNLVLAGTFVGFAGTYLKNHTNWKDQHRTLKSDTDKKLAEQQSSIDALNQTLVKAQAENRQIDQLNKSQKSELDDKRAETERLAKQMASLEADIKQMKSDYSTVAIKLAEAAEDAKKTLQVAMTADEEKHKALNAQKDAEAKLAEASAKIANFETKVADLSGDISKREQTIAEQKVMLDNWKLRFPNQSASAQADVEGRIHLVAANGLVTIQVTDKKGDLKKGDTMAAFADGSYKGDITISSVESNGTMAFGKVTLPVEGKPIKVGDRVSSHLTK